MRCLHQELQPPTLLIPEDLYRAEDFSDQRTSLIPGLLEIFVVLGFLMLHETVSACVQAGRLYTRVVEPDDIYPFFYISCSLFFLLLTCAGASCMKALHLTLGYIVCIALYLVGMLALTGPHNQMDLDVQEFSEYEESLIPNQRSILKQASTPRQ